MQLVVDNLAKSFGVKTIFKNVSFMIDKGEKIGLVGVNGSGKSTLLHCLLQNGYSDSGSVRFEARWLCGAGLRQYRQRQPVAVYDEFLPGNS